MSRATRTHGGTVEERRFQRLAKIRAGFSRRGRTFVSTTKFAAIFRRAS